MPLPRHAHGAFFLVALTAGAVIVAPAVSADVTVGACARPFTNQVELEHEGPPAGEHYAGVYVGPDGPGVYRDRGSMNSKCPPRAVASFTLSLP